jgi:hypothetical protein
MIVVPNRVVLAVFMLLPGACVTPPPSQTSSSPTPIVAPWETIPLTDGRSVVRRMRARYDGRFPKTIVFRQENTLYPASGGEQRSEWLEYASIPGRLRVEYMPASNQSGVLYADRKITVFESGRITRSDAYVHPLMVLLYDVHALPADTTVALIDSLHFNLSALRKDTWMGRPAYVIGAAAGDTTTNQFWVDAERLVTVRVIQTDKRGARSVLNETRLESFVEYGGAPIATEIVFLRDGRSYFREAYRDVRVNETLDDVLFDPARWSTSGSFSR